MNYEELQKANDLLEKIKEIDYNLRAFERADNNIRIAVNDYLLFLDKKYKKKFIDSIKEIRDELVEELNKLGVVED